MLEAVMLFCISAVAYNYVGYPIVLFALSLLSQARSDLRYLARRVNRRCTATSEGLPRVAILVAAYNEEEVIEAKLRNCFALDYPADRLEFLLGLDAPTDHTADILARMASSRLRVSRFARRRGKLAVLSDLAEQTSADILVFSDANTMLDRGSIRSMVRHFADPRVGAVTGEEIRIDASENGETAESLYWRYESAIRILENRLGCCLGANGALFALRRQLFSPREQAIVEDLQIPLRIRQQGYLVIYDPEAIATEEAAPTQSAQFVRRIRIGAGDYQALVRNVSLLSPRNGLQAFCFLSHKVLRWLAPFFLLTAFACSIPLGMRSEAHIIVLAQWAFYLTAALAYGSKKRGKTLPVASAALHFCAMNAALLIGFLAFIRQKQSLAWQVTPRRAACETLLAGPANIDINVECSGKRVA